MTVLPIVCHIGMVANLAVNGGRPICGGYLTIPWKVGVSFLGMAGDRHWDDGLSSLGW